jgi:uncharacterized delta-60 repeat protein
MKIFIYLVLFFCSKFVFGQSLILDNSFGNNGIFYTPPDSLERVFSLKEGPDGKIILLSTVQIDPFFDSLNLHLRKFFSNGQPDLSFGNNGLVKLFYGEFLFAIPSMAIQSDGKILINWYKTNTLGVSVCSTTRLLSNGNLDTSFGLNGEVITALSPRGTKGGGIALQSDGKIIVGGTISRANGSCAFLIRLYPDGTRDFSFKNIADLYLNTVDSIPHAYVDCLSIGTDDKILFTSGRSTLSGSDREAALLVKLLKNGQLDLSFGKNGIASSPSNLINNVSNFTEIGYRHSVLPNGDIVLCGKRSFLAIDSSDFLNYAFVSMFDPTGKSKLSFGIDGIILKRFFSNSAENESIADIIIEGSSNILLTGYYFPVNSYNSIISNVNTNGNFEPSFGTNGRQIINLPNINESVGQALLKLRDGKFLLSGYCKDSNGKRGLYLARFNPLSTNTSDLLPGLVSFSVQPNLVESELQLLLELEEEKKVGISIFSVDGKEVKTLAKETLFTQGKSVLSYNVNGLNAGMYFVLISDGIHRQSMPFVKR